MFNILRPLIFKFSPEVAHSLAIKALKLKKDSEAIVPVNTWISTAEAVVEGGLKLVFCDVNLTSYVPNIEDVLEKITDKTKAVMIPNLIGNKPDWKRLRHELIKIDRRDIKIIEDSADTITFTKETDVSTTSFYASHVITAGGAGGMVMFNDETHLKRALQFRDWGRIGNNSEFMDDRFNHKVDGIPYDFKFLVNNFFKNWKPDIASFVDSEIWPNFILKIKEEKIKEDWEFASLWESDEEKFDDLDEAPKAAKSKVPSKGLSPSQRRKMAIRMKIQARKPSFIMKRQRAMKRAATKAKLLLRARKAAIKKVIARFYPKLKTKKRTELSYAERGKISQIVKKKAGLIARFAKRMVKDKRKQDVERRKSMNKPKEK